VKEVKGTRLVGGTIKFIYMWKKVLRSIEEYYSEKIADLNRQIEEKRDSAAKSPGSMQSWSDKSKQEFSQLANALLKNLEPLKISLKSVKEILSTKNKSNAISIGSIIKTKSDEEDQERLVIVPGVGGDQIIVDDIEYFLLSAKSELANQLLEKKPGQKLTLKSGTEITIIEVINS